MPDSTKELIMSFYYLRGCIYLIIKYVLICLFINFLYSLLHFHKNVDTVHYQALVGILTWLTLLLLRYIFNVTKQTVERKTKRNNGKGKHCRKKKRVRKSAGTTRMADTCSGLQRACLDRSADDRKLCCKLLENCLPLKADKTRHEPHILSKVSKLCSMIIHTCYQGKISDLFFRIFRRIRLFPSDKMRGLGNFFSLVYLSCKISLWIEK